MATEPLPPIYDRTKVRTIWNATQHQEILTNSNGAISSIKLTNFRDVKIFRGTGQAQSSPEQTEL